jgi:hypothetical protein
MAEALFFYPEDGDSRLPAVQHGATVIFSLLYKNVRSHITIDSGCFPCRPLFELTGSDGSVAEMTSISQSTDWLRVLLYVDSLWN